MPCEELIIIFVLLKRFHRAGIHAMRLFALAADKGIGYEFSYGNNTVIIRMIVEAAFNLAILALTRSAYIQVNEKFFIH